MYSPPRTQLPPSSSSAASASSVDAVQQRKFSGGDLHAEVRPAGLLSASERYRSRSRSARVWVNRSGSLTGQPLQRAQLQRRIVIAGVLTAVMLGLVLCLVGGAGRYLFSRRRLADWDKAWRVVGPRWTRQL
jgi:hypothetical protein